MARMRDVQMHVIVLDQDSDGSPRNELFELTSECLNLVWQKSANLAANCAFTLMRNSRKLPKLDPMRHHIRVIREDDNGATRVFTGKITQPDWGARDVVILCWDYLSFLAKNRIDYYLNDNKKKYSSKDITFVIESLIDAVINKTDGQLDFVTKGTIQTLLGLDGVTHAKTNNSFAIANLQDTLTVLFDLAEMAMTNTPNTVVYEITDTSPHQFNLWKDRGVDRTKYTFTYPGNIMEYGYVETLGTVVNDFATLVKNSDKTTGLSQVTIELPGTGQPAGIGNLRRLQGAGTIGTLIGFDDDTDTKGQQRMAAERLARRARRIPRYLTIYPRQGYFAPFVGTGLMDAFQVHIQRADGTDNFNKYMRLHSVAAAWSAEAGESLQLFLRNKDLT